MTTASVNSQSQRLAFRCPLDLAADLRLEAGEGSVSEVIVERLRRCAELEATLAALRDSDPTIPRW